MREKESGQCCNCVAVNPQRLKGAEYMGSGATLVEGVRRWFQRRSSSTSTTINTNPNNNSKQPSNSNYSRNNFVNDHNDAHVSVSDLSPQSSTSHQREQKQGQEYQLQFEVEDDFDISGLKLISVPKRADFRAPPMDSQKKVLSRFFCISGSGFLLFYSSEFSFSISLYGH